MNMVTHRAIRKARSSFSEHKSIADGRRTVGSGVRNGGMSSEYSERFTLSLTA